MPIMIDGQIKKAINDTQSEYPGDLLTIVLSPRGLDRLQMFIAQQERRRVQKVIRNGLFMGLATYIEKNQVEPFRIVVR